MCAAGPAKPAIVVVDSRGNDWQPETLCEPKDAALQRKHALPRRRRPLRKIQDRNTRAKRSLEGSQRASARVRILAIDEHRARASGEITDERPPSDFSFRNRNARDERLNQERIEPAEMIRDDDGSGTRPRAGHGK